MNAIHQISLKLRLGIDTHAKIQPEVLLEKWQDLVDSRLHAHSQPEGSAESQAGSIPASNDNAVRRA